MKSDESELGWIGLVMNEIVWMNVECIDLSQVTASQVHHKYVPKKEVWNTCCFLYISDLYFLVFWRLIFGQCTFSSCSPMVDSGCCYFSCHVSYWGTRNSSMCQWQRVHLSVNTHGWTPYTLLPFDFLSVHFHIIVVLFYVQSIGVPKVFGQRLYESV